MSPTPLLATSHLQMSLTHQNDPSSTRARFAQTCGTLPPKEGRYDSCWVTLLCYVVLIGGKSPQTYDS